MTEDEFPNDAVGKYLFADWLDEAGATLEARAMRAKGDVLKVVENIQAGLHDQQLGYTDWVQTTIDRARNKRSDIVRMAKEIAATQSIRERLKVGDHVEISHSLLTRIGGLVYRNYNYAEVEGIDGDMVNLSIKFTSRNRRCSTGARVNISEIASILRSRS